MIGSWPNLGRTISAYKNNIEHLVMLTNGQQGMGWPLPECKPRFVGLSLRWTCGQTMNPTGAKNHYKRPFKKDGTKNVQPVKIDKRSLAARLRTSGWFPESKTFMALVFDAGRVH